MLRSVFRFVIGSSVGLFLWWFGIPLYAVLIAHGARPLLTLRPAFSGVHLRSVGRQMEIAGPAVPRARIPFDQLTYNVVLLLGLFATVKGIWKDRNVGRLAGSILLLSATHVLATTVNVLATYATRLGGWSDQHFSGLQQDLWTAADYSYRLGGMFAIAFACWYIATQGTPQNRPIANG